MVGPLCVSRLNPLALSPLGGHLQKMEPSEAWGWWGGRGDLGA